MPDGLTVLPGGFLDKLTKKLVKLRVLRFFQTHTVDFPAMVDISIMGVCYIRRLLPAPVGPITATILSSSETVVYFLDIRKGEMSMNSTSVQEYKKLTCGDARTRGESAATSRSSNLFVMD